MWCKPLRVLAGWLLCMPMLAMAQAAPGVPAGEDGPAVVRVVHADGRYQLQVDGKPFYVKGGGMSGNDQQALVARGGNSFRTWHSGENHKDVIAMLDQARRNGLMVAMGIEVARERHGFDYNDAQAVAEQLQRIRREVLDYKDHPAVLMWVVGNELNLEATNPAVWTAVGQLADMIHRIDPNHPVMTTLAGFDKPLIDAIKARAPSLDLIGVQLYGDISALPEKLRTSGWTGPYIVTEWGPTGHWESPLTAWGAPIEDTSTRKAQLLTERYQRYIASDTRQGLGSYVFLWGNKQERTPTWYGLFLPTGESTPSVDAMQLLWTGKPADNRAPSIAVPSIDGQFAQASVTLLPGSTHQAQAMAEDPEGDPLQYRWSMRAESAARTTGGDPEDVPALVDVPISKTANGAMRFVAPGNPGAYRLFVEVRDGRGHAAYANFPFRVQAAK
ncbi:glycoside hydrolase family 2 TIM barrel-domain containing protein [Pseudoxanthomonas sp.]|uniref:glycoside hydrolase family 2 TIM barrel-domain containing protein n=1 Tax=Pseudoxanthomonas sp. TaxID=1871049 RepID=UPI00260C2A82|nr:glycoside hydrolase family 2 TIM barrel-domain containing protein [Pseudoxanthomonas sp.]WDS37910.1 MAG: glycoside hydrolase family 2 TIM barrel-domain containing protein [Pseudoxanthomonas sp.]